MIRGDAMKKFFAVACLVATIFICGCGGDKTAEQPAEPKVEQPAPEPEKVDAVAVDGTIWAIDEENVAYLIDALDRNDGEYLKQLSVEQKAFLVDRDTKVTRIGKPAANDTVMIKFKEGRYTNKTGYTRARNIFTEEEYPAYLEAKAAREQAKKDAERQEIIDLVQNYLSGSENYYDVITGGNVDEMNQMHDFLKAAETKLIELKKAPNLDSNLREYVEKTHKIIINRGAAFLSIFHSMEFAQKSTQENLSQSDRKYYVDMSKNSATAAVMAHKNADKLRQEFRDKYGF